MKFILRLGLALLTGFVSVSTARTSIWNAVQTLRSGVSQNLINRI